MKGEGIEPTEATYGICISALAKSGEWTGALKHFDEMMQVDVACVRNLERPILISCLIVAEWHEADAQVLQLRLGRMCQGPTT